MILGHRIQWLDFSVVDICGHEEWVITKVKWVGVVAGVRKRFCLSNEDDVGERIYYRVEAFIGVAAIFYNLQIRFPSNCPITGEKLGQIPAKNANESEDRRCVLCQKIGVLRLISSPMLLHNWRPSPLLVRPIPHRKNCPVIDYARPLSLFGYCF